MKPLLTCLSLLLATSPAIAADFVVVENWLKPAEGMQTIGPAHGDVAVSSAGEVYVSVAGARGGIQVFDQTGRYLRNVPNAPPDFHGFVIHQEAGGEFIYGARLNGGAILKLHLDGQVALQVPGDMIPEELVAKRRGERNLRLTSVDVAPDGRIFAVDGYSTDLIHIFDAQGKYLQSFGGKAAPYGFRTCHKIAIDTRFDPPQILCCDRENRRMVRLTLDGQVLGIIPNLKRPAAVAIFKDWAAIAEIEGQVSVLNKAGNVVTTFGTNDVKTQTATSKVAPADWRSGILTAPHGIDFDSTGSVFVTEFNQFGRVLRYDQK